jgi:hypothetical protein
MSMCPACGTPNSLDAKFCFNCGALVSRGPPVKVEVRAPLTPSMKATPFAQAPPMHASRQAQRWGSCYYHPELPSSYICSRCGRSICSACNRSYGALSLCTQCYWGLAPRLGYPPPVGQFAVATEQPARSPFSFF